MPHATVAASMLRSLLEYLRAQELDTTAITATAGIQAVVLTHPERPIDARHYIALMRAGIEASQNPLLGLEFGIAAQPERWGTLGLLLRHCGDLGEVLAAQHRFAHLVNAIGHAQLAHHETDVALDWHTDAQVIPAVTEEALAAWVGFARWASGHEARPITVMFAHRAQGDPAIYHDFFGCPVHFGTSSNSLHFDPALLALPLRTPDRQLTSLLSARVTARQKVLDSRHIVDRLRSWLTTQLMHTTPDLTTAAAALGLSERMLQYRLQACNSRYRDCVDASRRELATHYLADASLSIGDIAIRLGYSEQSAFQRAFRRWHGTTPMAWRRSRGNR